MAGSDLSATVILRDADGIDSIPERVVLLAGPSWQVKIGRGTMSGDEGLRPAEDNTWFDSRVMSRNHAILRANPDTREFTIEDVGSMHGTQRNGRKLHSNSPEAFFNRDTLIFGADVIRGSSSFRALKVTIAANWSDEKGLDSTVSFPPSYRNTFTADYSEEDVYDDAAEDDDEDIDDEDAADDDIVYDQPGFGSLIGEIPPTSSNWQDYYEEEPEDEIEFVKESVRAPSIEIILPPRNFSVPDSEISDGSSDASDNEVTESPTSSPVGPSDDGSKKEENNQTPNTFTARADVVDKRSPADVIYSESAISVSPIEDEVDYSEPEIDDDDDDEDEDGAPEDHETSTRQMFSIPSYMHIKEVESELKGKSTLQTRVLEATRTPSPSDAAMVKPPTDCMPMAPPFLQAISAFNEHAAHLYNPDRRDPAWAGHNSVLYDSVVRPGLDYQNGYNTGYAFDNQYAIDQSSVAYPAIPTYEAFSSSETRVTKCSIAQILDQSKSDGSEVEATPAKGLKRKADEISDFTWDTSLDSSSNLNINADGEVPKDNASTGHDLSESDQQGIEIPSAKIVPSSAVKGSPEDTGAPARKKVKTGDKGRSQHGGFLRLVAATFAGVAIGTVGTIVGLASLPQEYFL